MTVFSSSLPLMEDLEPSGPSFLAEMSHSKPSGDMVHVPHFVQGEFITEKCVLWVGNKNNRPQIA